jgi:hypothetical protein
MVGGIQYSLKNIHPGQTLKDPMNALKYAKQDKIL